MFDTSSSDPANINVVHESQADLISLTSVTLPPFSGISQDLLPVEEGPIIDCEKLNHGSAAELSVSAGN